MATRIGVDVGGTFTDVIFYDDRTGEVRVAKAPTTAAEPEVGVLHAVANVVDAERLARVEFFMHGATIGLNALLQRTGATTALLCTAGFRDSIEIRRGDRTSMYDLHWRAPEPLVPRRLRLPVEGRIRADGHELAPLSEADVAGAVEMFEGAGVRAVAVCFLNSYVNPAHELLAETLLRDLGFRGDISLSHRLTREYREYERTSTTIVDAYIRGVTWHYLGRLSDALSERGFGGELLIMRSGGGVMGAEEIVERPFEAIQSGPVAGAGAAADLCQANGWQLEIAADVGGTSFDTTLITDGKAHVRHEGEIAGWPLLSPWVDVRSIGAGGGSIAYVHRGLLRVGPRSASAVPGPACYGRGGESPTVTDAACLLGLLGDGRLGSGLVLDRDLAERSFGDLSNTLGMIPEEAARGVMTIASAAMADAIREITIGEGKDPRTAHLLAFGGAGPMFATLLATELQVRDVVIPRHPGNFSAWGLIGQDRTHEAARTLIRPWDRQALADAQEQLREMLEELTARRNDAPVRRPLETEASLALRYVGQDHTVPVAVDVEDGHLAASVEDVAAAFQREYARRFEMTLELGLELVVVRASIRELLPRASGEGLPPEIAESSATSRAYSFRRAEWLDALVLDRATLTPGEPVLGPAIVREPTATIYVDDGFDISVHTDGSLLLTDTKHAG